MRPLSNGLKNLMYSVIRGDCLEETKKIASESVNLIIIDPPYGNLVKEEWDKSQNPFNEELCNELYRILHSTGSIYCWCRYR